jgi:hypothetical protein
MIDEYVSVYERLAERRHQHNHFRPALDATSGTGS